MAFVLLELGETFHAEVFRRGSAYYVLVRVGLDENRKTNYFVEVGLQPVMASARLEFQFCLIGVSPGRDPEPFWSGRDLPGDISQSDRKAILDVVLSATRGLLDQVKPEEVCFVHDASMPPRALAKYEALCVTFADCGYEVAVADVYQGSRMMKMTRRSSS